MDKGGGRGPGKKWMNLRAILEMKLMRLANKLGVGMSQRAYLCPNVTIFLYLKLFFMI